MLAYVFWHWPAPTVDAARYAESLVAFHRALASTPPPGVRSSRVYELEAAPWLPVARAFEDWYLVDDFAALGALNEAAVSGARREPHDAAARLAGGGHGGVYRLLAPARGGTLPRTTWCSKPGGASYPEFVAQLPPGETWQRQMVLGPAPEFCIIGVDAAAALGGVAVAARKIHASP
ncbi:hypothetical protein [Anaeromyxobacter terrae]|uniref:hypothetical protein n=1 Tax=Anaeromyxobacter terrae TaxID=2925406 RepID=UPI001F57D9C9|nr:hypothetical protein [Anaeromyxobacter sp. SG22]